MMDDFLLRNHLRLFSESALASCGGNDATGDCRDEGVALLLKVAAIAAILISGIGGVALPLVSRKRDGGAGAGDGGFFVLAKAFAAGVILATGFVHMLHDAEEALGNPCLSAMPWQRFPFSGFVAMLAALGTLVLDFVGTQYYERKHRMEEAESKVDSVGSEAEALLEGDHIHVAGIVTGGSGEEGTRGERADEMHIVGIHAHAAEHRHSHAHVQGACSSGHPHHVHAHDHGHGNEHDNEGSGLTSNVRHVVVSQILELGIVSHSVIIGLSLGVSQSPCTIRPLIAALSFHQFFEGFALGGCIAQAQFTNLATILMASFFAITTPLGIAVGIGISSFYDGNSPLALVVEGMLDSLSAGILIYMALVDLIAADFLSSRMSCNVRVQVGSYIALFIGALAMASLAIWE